VVGVATGSGGGKKLMLNIHTDPGHECELPRECSERQDPRWEPVQSGLGGYEERAGGAARRGRPGETGKSSWQCRCRGCCRRGGPEHWHGQIIEASQNADAYIVCEPSLEELVICHKVFAWFEVTIYGVAAHGSRFDFGVDAITRAGYFLVQLHKHAQSLIEGKSILF